MPDPSATSTGCHILRILTRFDERGFYPKPISYDSNSTKVKYQRHAYCCSDVLLPVRTNEGAARVCVGGRVREDARDGRPAGPTRVHPSGPLHARRPRHRPRPLGQHRV